MLRVALALIVLVSGCPAPAPGGGATGPIVGERWRFDLSGLAEQTYEVIAVSADEVRYAVQTSQDGVALGDPLEQAFPRRPGPAPFERGAAGPKLVVGGRIIETWVTQDGAERVTTAVVGRTPVFPGVVKVERGELVLVELVDVR